MLNLLLAGMPNSGKSTLFNLLTKGDAKVGNWHGITVKTLQKTAKINGESYTVIDTPGIYSLTPYTLEERASLNAIKNHAGVIVFLTEAINLKKSLDIVKELILSGKKVVLAVNMASEFYKGGGTINLKDLVAACPFPVVVGDFNIKADVSKILNAVKNFKVLPFNINMQKALNAVKIPEYKECLFDRLILKGFVAPIFLIGLIALTLYLAFGKFGVGWALSQALSKLFSIFIPVVEGWLLKLGVSKFVSGLVLDGVLGGLLGVIAFLPQTSVLLIILTLLERSGVMPRLSYLSEGLLHKTGLNGRAVFSALTGLGCSAVSVLSTGGLENSAVKKKAVLFGGGISCSAKIPVFLLLSGSVKYPFLYILLIYVSEVFIAIFQLFLADNLIVKQKRAPLVMEMPPYRLPSLKETLKALLKIVKQSIIKIGTVIFVISLAVYLLKSLSISFVYVGDNVKNSMLAAIGRALTPIFTPLGISDWRLTSALIAGVFAKEAIASTLISLYPLGVNLAMETLLPLTLFIMLYPPCVTALYAVMLETGKRFFVKYLINFYIQAYLFAFILKLVINRPITLIILAVLVLLVIIYEKFYGRKKLKINKVFAFSLRRKAKLFNSSTPSSK